MFKCEDYVGKSIILKNRKIKLTNFITSGGNSAVYKCEYLNKNYVIKFFKGKKKRYERFKQEVEKINYLNEKIEGFTPNIIDKYLPEYNYQSFQKVSVLTSPFYIMEEAKCYEFVSLTFEQKLSDIIVMCNALKKMHDINIQHRDIKPENILKYNGNISFIDYGTACMPGFETIDAKEAMGSKGTMAPEMVNQAYGISGYKFEYADVYSLGKTIWIILTNDRNAHKFTTYNTSNVSSKVQLDGVHDGIVMALERIIIGATRENYLERISLEEIIESLIIIRDGLLDNNENCNIMKFKCLLEDCIDAKYDAILISNSVKKAEFIRKICGSGVNLSLKESGKDLCNSLQIPSFSIEPDSDEYYYFVINGIKFIFKIEEILIDNEKVCIKTSKLTISISGEDSKYFRNIDSFSKKSILINPIDSITKNIYLECDICLNVIE